MNRPGQDVRTVEMLVAMDSLKRNRGVVCFPKLASTRWASESICLPNRMYFSVGVTARHLHMKRLLLATPNVTGVCPGFGPRTTSNCKSKLLTYTGFCAKQ